MKGTKLQIGDYVFIKSLYGGYHTTLIKIAAVHQGKVGYHNVPNKLNWVRIGMLEPIPLTSEILEKIGFDRVPQSDCSNPYYWEFNEYEEETNALLYHIKAYSNPFRGMDIFIDNFGDCATLSFTKQMESLHELQQALRLCGIDKLADNLKVEEKL